MPILGIIASSYPVGTAFESIATVTAAGGETSLTFSSIPSNVKFLQIRGIARCNSGAGTTPALLNVVHNNAASYYYIASIGTGASSSVPESSSATSMPMGHAASSASTAGTFSANIIDFTNLTGVSYRSWKFKSGAEHNSTNPAGAILDGFSYQYSAQPTSVTISIAGGIAFAAGSSFALYGIRG